MLINKENGRYFTISPTKYSYTHKEILNASKNLTDVIIPDGVEASYGNVFEMCDSLERIFIPQSVTLIMENAFDQRKRKKKLIIQAPKGSYAIEYAKKMRFKYEYVEENPYENG